MGCGMPLSPGRHFKSQPWTEKLIWPILNENYSQQSHWPWWECFPIPPMTESWKKGLRTTAFKVNVSRIQLLGSSYCVCSLLGVSYLFLCLQLTPMFPWSPHFYLQFLPFFWVLDSYQQLSTRQLPLDLTCLNQTHYLPKEPLHFYFLR